MTRPTLSILIPTHREDRPLRRALNAIAPQLKHGDEVVVVGDTHSGDLPMVEHLVHEFGPQYRYMAVDAGHHCYGHCPLDAGIATAEGDYIHCSDDDDIHTEDALKNFRKFASAVPKPLPFLFRFKSYVGPIFWVRAGLFARNWIGGHCLLMPNVKGKLGKFTCEYNGDFDYVESAVNHYGGPQNAVWREELVAIARPNL